MFTRHHHHKGQWPPPGHDLERYHSQTPDQKWEHFCQTMGLDELEAEEAPPEKPQPPKSPVHYEDTKSPPIRYVKPPSLSLSTRKGQGQRAKLVYCDKRKKRYALHGLGGPEEFTIPERLKKRRDKLATARSARFSKTVDLDWRHGGILGHRQLTVFLDDLGANENLLGFAPLLRRIQPSKKSMANKRRPLLYQQQTTPFYYALGAHWEVFHRSWSHAVRAANVVAANRQGIVWPNVKWGKCSDKENVDRQVVELCRTPLPSVVVHYPDGSKKHSIPHNPEFPTAYEVVELVCQQASEINRAIFYESGEQKSSWNKNDSNYRRKSIYYLQFRREARSADGEKLAVSYLGFSRGLTLPVATVTNLSRGMPDFFEDVAAYLAGHPDQSDCAVGYNHHPNPLVNRWGFYASDELRGGAAKLAETFTTATEEAYLRQGDLYASDSPRFRQEGAEGCSIPRDLHPLYHARLAALAAGELLWRSEWAVDESQALQDVSTLLGQEDRLISASVFIYTFCAAFVRVFLGRQARTRYARVGVRTRKSLNGQRLIKLKFCRGPPSFR